MGRRIPIDEPRLRALVMENRPDHEVAAALGVSASTVRRRRRELSLERAAPRTRSARATWTSSFVVRCTPGELARLDARAGDQARHDYVRALLFGEVDAPRVSGPRRTQPRAEVPPPPPPPDPDPTPRRRSQTSQRRERMRAGVLSTPAPQPVPTSDFAAEFGAAFEPLRRARRVNLVPLSSLREALSGYPRESFDRELYELRRTGAYVLESYDGRHGKPKPAELEGGIREGGRLMVYVVRRDD